MHINDYILNAYMNSYIVNSKINNKFNKIIISKKDTVKISKLAKIKAYIAKECFPKYKNNYLYFENKDCCFYPCHQDIDKGMNCMFCRCPLYNDLQCPGIINGDAIILETGIKDCSNCTWNHEYNNAEFLSNYPGDKHVK